MSSSNGLWSQVDEGEGLGEDVSLEFGITHRTRAAGYMSNGGTREDTSRRRMSQTYVDFVPARGFPKNQTLG